MARYRRRNSKGRFAGFGRKHHRKSVRGIGRKSHKRGRRSYKGFGGLGDLPKVDTVLKSSVTGQDVLMGAGLGLLGVLALNYYVNTHDHKAGLDPTKAFSQRFIKSPVQNALFAAGAAAAAGILGYSFMHKDGGNKWTGMMIGAIGTGIAIGGQRLVDSGYVNPKLLSGPTAVYPKAGFVPMAGYNGGYGMLMHDRNRPTAGYGMILHDKQAAPKALAALSLALDDADEIEKMLSGQ